MKTRAAAIVRAPQNHISEQYEIIELDLEEPRQGEILVKMVAAGLCHSDDHYATGDVPIGSYPFVGGHEGGGIVMQVGDYTPGFSVGDHVVFSFLPSCGRCRWCASGRQNLCDLGAGLLTGGRPEEPTSFRMHLANGRDVGQMCCVGSFSEYTTVSVNSAVKIDNDLPLEKMCLLGCAVGTGWGSAQHSAAVEPGDTVIVMGIGGIGINAVQGAVHCGASHVIGVDPIEFKRDKAAEFGATECFATMKEATMFAKSVTNGQGADSAIVTVGIVKGEHVKEAFSSIRKAGTVVVTGLGDVTERGIPISLSELTLYQKRIQGSLYGQCSPSSDILRHAQMYRDGVLKLDGLITKTYSLDEIAQGYKDLHAGLTIRGVVLFP